MIAAGCTIKMPTCFQPWMGAWPFYHYLARQCFSKVLVMMTVEVVGLLRYSLCIDALAESLDSKIW
jgi:hypothetical protein